MISKFPLVPFEWVMVYPLTSGHLRPKSKYFSLWYFWKLEERTHLKRNVVNNRNQETEESTGENVAS